MSEFLVFIEVRRPANTPDAEWASLLEREAARGREYRISGIISRIWRVPGTRQNIGIWEAADATELHARISALPMFDHMSIEVRPLALHYLETYARTVTGRTRPKSAGGGSSAWKDTE
ncbi:muconolactone Delta-isomerase [Arthrobacter sp. SD76]|uniref:muconolactone Delta-isomerase n=1 Tax=Arthrobacter sp. SD76 TaxID=3415007 RepID=UPI003C708F07